MQQPTEYDALFRDLATKYGLNEQDLDASKLESLGRELLNGAAALRQRGKEEFMNRSVDTVYFDGEGNPIVRKTTVGALIAQATEAKAQNVTTKGKAEAPANAKPGEKKGWLQRAGSRIKKTFVKED